MKTKFLLITMLLFLATNWLYPCPGCQQGTINQTIQAFIANVEDETPQRPASNQIATVNFLKDDGTVVSTRQITSDEDGVFRLSYRRFTPCSGVVFLEIEVLGHKQRIDIHSTEPIAMIIQR